MRVTKQDLILEIARRRKIKIDVVKEIYNALEDLVFETICNTTEEDTKVNPIDIRLFEGISLNSYYEPEKEKKVNYIKDDKDSIVTVKSKIKLKAFITNNLKNKINKN